MRILSSIFLLIGVLAMSNFIYYVPVNFTFPDEIYERAGSRTANFQYIVLSKSNCFAIILKGWLFQPVEIVQPKSFIVEVTTEGGFYQIKIPPVRKGIYLNLPEHLFVLPENTKKVSVNSIEIPLFSLKYSVEETRGRDTPGIEILNSSFEPSSVFDYGEQIFVKVSAGRKNTGGYRVSVDSLNIEGRTIKISAHVESPSPNTPVIQVITYPAVLIKIDGPLDAGEYKVICTLSDSQNVQFEVEFTVE